MSLPNRLADNIAVASAALVKRLINRDILTRSTFQFLTDRGKETGARIISSKRTNGTARVTAQPMRANSLVRKVTRLIVASTARV